ncbi:MAG TPA: hypothetical protein DIS78_07790, partial [Lachnospiraceae bacterium]|nr:hypothetical protein [Lachnospiraceae bacterium]
MKRSFRLILSLILALAVLLTTPGTPVYASVFNEEVTSGDILADIDDGLLEDVFSEDGLTEEDIPIEKAPSQESDILLSDTASLDVATEGTGTEQATTEKTVYDTGSLVPADQVFYDTDFHKVKDGIDLKGVDYVKIVGRVKTRSYYAPKTCDLKLVDQTSGKVIGTATCSSSGADSSYNFTAKIKRSDKETWDYSDACVYARLGADTFNAVKHASTMVSKISLGYPLYGFKIGSDNDISGEYTEKIYTGEEKYENGNQVKYPKPCFANGNGEHSYETTAYAGQTVTTSVWEGGGTNSQGVAADSTTLKFKGYKLLKPGSQDSLSGFICTGDSFTLSTDFPVKYRDYMSPDCSFTLVPCYEPLPETVEFSNSNASVDGKEDVKGVYSGFRSGYKLKATMLDTIRVSAKANDGYMISYIELQKPNGAVHYTNRPDIKWTRWKTMSDNRSFEDKTLLASPINFNGQMYTNEAKTTWSHRNYCRVVISYDTNTSSITLAPSPQQIKTGTENCKIVYAKGSGGNKSMMVPKKAGELIELSDTIVRSPYIFGAMPTGDYHAYWKDGTLDSDGDGVDDLKLPGYEPFIPTFGNQFMFIQNVPLKNKIYYNFVKDTTSEDVAPLPLTGCLKISDKLLLSGREVKRGLSGIKVFSNGQSTETKGSDGYFELVSNNKFKFYDLYNYIVSFTGKDGDDTIALMQSRNPGRTSDIVIDATLDVDISDVKLYKESSGDYAAIDISSATDGYIRLPADNGNYRLKMSA